MLKITTTDHNGHHTLVLEGKLVDPWVSELESTWNQIRHANEGRDLLVDLKDVTLISERGERLLSQMMVEGAKFNCCRGVLTRHVVGRLVQRCTAALKSKKDVKS